MLFKCLDCPCLFNSLLRAHVHVAHVHVCLLIACLLFTTGVAFSCQTCLDCFLLICDTGTTDPAHTNTHTALRPPAEQQKRFSPCCLLSPPPPPLFPPPPSLWRRHTHVSPKPCDFLLWNICCCQCGPSVPPEMLKHSVPTGHLVMPLKHVRTSVHVVPILLFYPRLLLSEACSRMYASCRMKMAPHTTLEHSRVAKPRVPPVAEAPLDPLAPQGLR